MMIHLKTGVARLWAVVSVIALALFSGGCEQGAEEPAAVRERVRIGLPLDVATALVHIAHEKGFFGQAGLDVEVKNYPSGKRSLAGMLADEVDVSVPADIPVILAAFAGHDFRIVATVSTADRYQKIAARSDRGIRSPQDLKGKRVATQEKSAVHYFLYLFLRNHGLSEDDIQLSFLKAEQLPQALADGQIDAFSMREPYVSQAQQLLDGKLLVFDAPGLYRTTNNLVVKGRFVEQRPEALGRLVEGLVQAERFVASRPQEARKVVAKRLGISEAEASAAWENFDMRLSLSHVLLSGLDNGARWAIANGLTEQGSPPDFGRLVAPNALKGVAPAAVTLALAPR